MAAQLVPARVELFFKTEEELEKQVRQLSSLGVGSFNLTNKHKDDRLLEWIGVVGTAAPSADICAHYSLKYNAAGLRQGGADATYARFEEFLGALSRRRTGAEVEVLLVSGSGDKRHHDTVECLRLLRAGGGASPLGKAARKVSLGVAFNPYFQATQDRDRERSRLEQKLETGMVDSVWLQFGSDASLLASALTWMRTLGQKQPKRVVGSLFLPTRKLIAQQRYRPWNGVFLSETYLSGPEAAAAVTTAVLQVYRRFGVQALAEAPGVRTTDDVALLTRLLRSAERPSLSEGGDRLRCVLQKPSAKRQRTVIDLEP